MNDSNSELLIWRNGKLIAWKDATLHVMSQAVQIGSSVFEGIRCYETRDGPALFRVQEHIRRLLGSARIYRMSVPYDQAQLVQACREVVTGNKLAHCYLRPIVVRGGEEMGLLAPNAPIEVFVIPKVWGAYLGVDALAEGVDVSISSWRRPAPDTIPTLAKAGGNYLNGRLAKEQAVIDGYAEGVMLDVNGLMAEGSGENLFIVQDGSLYTAPVASGILKGITRDAVIRIAGDLGYTVIEQALPREVAYLADEIFFTGTAAEVTPVRSVDRMSVGTGKRGPITAAIQERFRQIVTGERADAYKWLTYARL